MGSNAFGNDDTKNHHANFARDQSWGFIVQCHYSHLVHDASDTCMSISASTWFFDSGASKHITSCRSLFTSLDDALKGGFVICANDASYVAKGIGQVLVTYCHLWRMCCMC